MFCLQRFSEKHVFLENKKYLLDNKNEKWKTYLYKSLGDASFLGNMFWKKTVSSCVVGNKNIYIKNKNMGKNQKNLDADRMRIGANCQIAKKLEDTRRTLIQTMGQIKETLRSWGTEKPHW